MHHEARGQARYLISPLYTWGNTHRRSNQTPPGVGFSLRIRVWKLGPGEDIPLESRGNARRGVRKLYFKVISGMMHGGYCSTRGQCGATLLAPRGLR
jgi:hypothetical protein